MREPQGQNKINCMATSYPSTQALRVQSLVWELRSHMLCGVAKNKQTNAGFKVIKV